MPSDCSRLNEKLLPQNQVSGCICSGLSIPLPRSRKNGQNALQTQPPGITIVPARILSCGQSSQDLLGLKGQYNSAQVKRQRRVALGGVTKKQASAVQPPTGQHNPFGRNSISPLTRNLYRMAN